MAASDYFGNLSQAILDSNMPGQAYIAVTPNSLANVIPSLYPSQSCAQIVTLVQTQMSPTFGFVAQPGVYVTPTNLAFIVAQSPPLDLVQQYTVNISDESGAVADYTWTFNADGSKNVVSVNVSNPTFTVPDSGVFSVFWGSDANDPYFINLPYNSYKTVDAPGFVGSLIPACAIATPLPTVGLPIKSANFTRLFNPLGLSLKDI